MPHDPQLENDDNARLKRIIRAAEELFKRVGFRAFTMESVARDANVAKATLYSHYKNKDELFLAVCARLARLQRSAVERALAAPGEPLDECLAAAIIAKHRMVFAFVRGWPHAGANCSPPAARWRARFSPRSSKPPFWTALSAAMAAGFAARAEALRGSPARSISAARDLAEPQRDRR